MITYVIVSQTMQDVYTCFYYTQDKIPHHIKSRSRFTVTINTKNVTLKFMSGEKYDKHRKSLKDVCVLSDDYFKEQLDKYLASEDLLVYVGDKVKFTDYRGMAINGYVNPDDFTYSGKVTYVNYEHRWFSIEYELGGVHQRTSFNFVDIGDNVIVIKRAKEKKYVKN